MQEVITHGLPAALVAPEPPEVEACLEYRADDPYAVSMVFGAECALGSSAVAWVFARQLLTDGIAASAGLGDVRVRPYDPEQTVIELRVDGGCAVLLVRTEDIRSFLTATYRAVPPGSEWRRIAWDEVLARLTGGQF
ncbi:SsgA family sporulation/cell division regulator [Kitasatospora sp. NPDC101801]|uniref:SsgA family sporulation/cell division regulator n=1 Tax=unclassified Kitasatospora TaxID=2633591 RepID=UPI00324D08CD